MVHLFFICFACFLGCFVVLYGCVDCVVLFDCVVLYGCVDCIVLFVVLFVFVLCWCCFLVVVFLVVVFVCLWLCFHCACVLAHTSGGVRINKASQTTPDVQYSREVKNLLDMIEGAHLKEDDRFVLFDARPTIHHEVHISEHFEIFQHLLDILAGFPRLER